MRGLAILALLATGLSACGGGGDQKNVKPVGANGEVAATASPSKTASSTAGEKATPAKKAVQLGNATYVAPTAAAKTSNGKTPAVVLLPDTGDKSVALGEASKLAAMGVATLVVEGPAATPSSASAFNDAVAETRLAIATLRKRPGIDRARIGVIGEGVGAHVAAVAIGRDPEAVHAAVLADIGGSVVPAPQYAPERWLERAPHTTMLFQRDAGGRAMTQAEMTRLMVAAPPGTLLQQYKKLDANAQAVRDKWIKAVLVVG